MATKVVRGIIPLKGISTGKRSVSFEAEGFQGQGCKQVTTAFENAVGSQVEEEYKAEYYDQEERSEFLNNGGDGGGDGGGY